MLYTTLSQGADADLSRQLVKLNMTKFKLASSWGRTTRFIALFEIG
jgi:hypothetical protein